MTHIQQRANHTYDIALLTHIQPIQAKYDAHPGKMTHIQAKNDAHPAPENSIYLFTLY